MMREQGISCLIMIVIVYPHPETDISQKSVNRCLSRATVRGQTAGLQSESHKHAAD